MAKIITSNFSVIHDALNRMIINEVKQALRWLPDKQVCSSDDAPLCRIVITSSDDYQPRDLRVSLVSLCEDDSLIIVGRYSDDTSEFPTQYYEDECDWLCITDFHHLINHVRDLLPDDGTCYNIGSTEDQNAVASAAYNSTLMY